MKSVEFHPIEPWVLTGLYNGKVTIWNYLTQTQVKSFEVTDVPVRCCKFIPKKNWIITGSDDFHLRIFNYYTGERVFVVEEAHMDYIRWITVHPNLPYVLSCSDDMTIKLWDWEKGWKNIQTFEGHNHYVMMIAVNPKDANTFASASLDKTIKIWNLGSPVANFTLEGHEKGVNTVDYYTGGDKPYLVSGSDDNTVKIWDYQNKTCIRTLEDHSQNVSATVYHPDIPIIISGSEDGSLKIWNSNTFRKESTISYGLERVWSVACHRSSNLVAIGYDEGIVVVQAGKEEPSLSMDTSGKIIWTKRYDVFTTNVKTTIDEQITDGDKIPLAIKDLGNCEIFPYFLQHSPNGRFVAVCGEGEYVIYTALAWRNKTFGSALNFVWSPDSNEYAIRESNTKIKLFKNFKERNVSFQHLENEIYNIFGGNLLAVLYSQHVAFFTWDNAMPVWCLPIKPNKIFWSQDNLLTIACDDTFHVYRFDPSALQSAEENMTEDGILGSFELLYQINENVATGCWFGDCFIYTNSKNRLNYLVGGKVFNLTHSDSSIYTLGYLPRDNRVYIADKDVNIYSYSLALSVIEYQTAILRGDFEAAKELTPEIPKDQRLRIARFLESQNLKELALEITPDEDHQFELSVELARLDQAYAIAEKSQSEAKWKLVGDSALSNWKFSLAEECFHKAKDYNSLLLLYTSTANAKALTELGNKALAEGLNNLAFLCFCSTHSPSRCLEILINTKRYPEASMFARTYLPSQLAKVVKLWKEDLQKQNKTNLAKIIVEPGQDSEEKYFPKLKESQILEEKILNNFVNLPAKDYSKVKDEFFPNFMKNTRNMNNVADGSAEDDEKFDTISDNMSYLSLEVNTAGSRSVLGDIDFDEVGSQQ